MFAFTFIFALYTFSVHTTLGIIPVTDNVVEQNIAFLAVEYWPCLMTIFIDHVYWDIVLTFRLRYLCWSGYCGNINTCVYEFVVLQINICSTGWLTANTCILNNWLMSMCLALFCHSICVIITKWVFTNVCSQDTTKHNISDLQRAGLDLTCELMKCQNGLEYIYRVMLYYIAHIYALNSM